VSGIVYLFNNNNVNFIISGLINDESLQQLKLLVVSYKDQPVNFTVNLQDDYRANKSFKFGNQGYIKISSEHWLINKL
ncbi:PrgH/EprH family type III secretion apparatus protein, partial [Rouxiella badensis]|uniref:PrgH/EprH family type III secretion apparatus protein n=1 Tax=Rouxiella badensis TaxID=1646377 RepID=UPI0028D7AA00